MSQTNDDNEALMVGTNFKVGRKLGAGNFGELRLGNVQLLEIQFYYLSDYLLDCLLDYN